MKKTIHWGILGTGSIANKFADDLRFVKDAVLTAVGSRKLDSARSFATAHSIAKSYGSYEELVTDETIDVIYIASPHSMHYTHTLLCLNNGKAVLCEKPFAMNLQQTKAMIALAKDKGLFLMEAMWTKFLPHFIAAKQMIREGNVGEVKSVTATFGFRPMPPVNPRMFDPALGGGTIMDIGVYNIFMALSFLGTPAKIDAVMIPTKEGVDAQCSIIFSYENGAMANLFSSFENGLSIEATVSGTGGRIRFPNRFYSPLSSLEYTNGKTFYTSIIPVEESQGTGYHYEATHVTECLLKGMTESDVLTFEDTITLMETMDEVRKKAGLVYEADTG